MSLLQDQYSDSRNFMARVELSRRFKTNPYSWILWIFDHINFPENAQVLEIGCGNGLLWKANLNRIPEDAHIILSDFSKGMLSDARRVLGDDAERFEYQVLDAQEIQYPDDSVDIVIANLMLYHIPDRKKAISEISRVLKSDGVLYATTFGIGNMREISELVSRYDDDIYYSLKPFAHAFGLENGEKQLSESFEQVQMIKYLDGLEVTEADPLVDYILSFEKVNEAIKGQKRKDFEDYLADIIEKEGIIKITKDNGMFIASNQSLR
ncbi:class I SAM-dependent methyltransferase [Methanobacterium sp.]|uniref:class I SAM-dependent methyltransferase n=1 Tax=Methanobacterium sp. TaxID=2164 RepID=UPI002AB81427|nr:class I SAM-dependent methyltransferase [Methanobacterium sp.]MDY9924053.1 class I SAM-dependent methyltransferase [Methanobacterium sp.]